MTDIERIISVASIPGYGWIGADAARAVVALLREAGYEIRPLPPPPAQGQSE